MGKDVAAAPEKGIGADLEPVSLDLSNDDEAVIQRVLSEHKPSKNTFIRGLWIVVGSLAVVFAVIGIVVPGWPTTSWLVLAAYCFARSSQKLFRWLLTNRIFGPALLEYYRSGRALPLHSKILISAIICVVSGVSIWGITKAGDPGYGQTLIAVVAIIGVWWVGWKVPTVD
jgi:uncharacterized membrane protein YbaN (DUF454 family)|tara:strand:- start:167 stop:679 length:513 start_codon:yes stop_codon:yes gene_type:complete